MALLETIIDVSRGVLGALCFISAIVCLLFTLSALLFVLVIPIWPKEALDGKRFGWDWLSTCIAFVIGGSLAVVFAWLSSVLTGLPLV